MDKNLLFPAILGSMIGYILYSFIKGITNDFFYRVGYGIGQFIADILRG